MDSRRCQVKEKSKCGCLNTYVDNFAFFLSDVFEEEGSTSPSQKNQDAPHLVNLAQIAQLAWESLVDVSGVKKHK